MSPRFLYFFLMLLMACHGNDKQQQEVTPTLPLLSPVYDSLHATGSDAHFYWEADLDKKEGLIVKRTTVISPDSLDMRMLITRLNELYPDVPFDLKRVSNDTAFLQVTDSRYLSQQMGSSGPEAWMAEVVYDITELPAVHYVDIAFKARDHGAPGTYSRTDFIMR